MATRKSQITSGKYRQSTHNVAETMQKLKEEREQKRSRLDARHMYIIETVARALNIENVEVEDNLLEGTQIEDMDKFFEIGGASRIMFYYQEMEIIDPTAQYSRVISETKPQSARQRRKKLFIANGTETPLLGKCVFFLRTNSEKPLTSENIHREINLHMMDATDGGVLNALEKLLSGIFIPAVRRSNKGWEGLTVTEEGRRVKKDFMNDLEMFADALCGAQDSLAEKIYLKECDDVDWVAIETPSQCQTASKNFEMLEKVEACVKTWIKQIELVLTESEQMRKEADNIGPRAELEHWKKRMSKFNFLLEQLKSPHVVAALTVLNFSKSKLIPSWKEIDAKITNYANEAKDNVKYLYTLEKFCAPLYESDPVAMLESVPGLINTIRMIHSISRYYNTSEKMTSLFVKVTNQMVSSCKAYLTNDYTVGVFEQNSNKVIKKINNCMKLNEEYQRHFQNTKKKLESLPNERKFDFSEMYIFGKFEAFKRRLMKILNTFDTMKIYAAIEASKIEGLEQMASKYQVICMSMKKKPYDILDQRKTDFDEDHAEFWSNITDLHQQLVDFMDEKFDQVVGTRRAVELLRKFEKLNIPEMNIDEKYAIVLTNFGKEIDSISRSYNREKYDPPAPRNMPPIAGKIMWARQLFRRIQIPMDFLQEEAADLLKGPEARRIIRNFNKVAKVLLEYEVLYHRGWLRQVDLAKAGLQASLLVKHPETQDAFVNFDPMIMTLIKETECMVRMGLDVPETANKIMLKSQLLKKHSNKMKV